MVGLAQLLLARSAPSEALPLARDAVRRRSRRAPYHVLLGDTLRALGQTAEAESEYRRALELDPDDRDAHQRLGE